ncbi:hypothetical protein J3T26_21585 [Salmonella enterica]|uniref:hypothetical protein n=1 Tax=Salmonella enterica TaxID=28901 RepID=UPI0021D4D69C|nr:hypothetical protein [Salmonella enterica]MCU7123278.1 hypothetical protein [Salmonella enterica]
MKLPERLYYPLPEAAAKLRCSVRDIYHFAAIGVLRVSCFIRMIKGTFLLVIPNCNAGEIDFADGGMIEEMSWIEGVKTSQVNGVDEHQVNAFGGFFYLGPDIFFDLEFLDNVEQISLYRLEGMIKGLKGAHIDRIDDPIVVDVRCLCIMANDLNNMGSYGKLYVQQGIESPIMTAKKASLIPTLLKLIPSLSDMNIDTEPVAKIVNVLEAAAIAKGEEIPSLDKNTWGRYLGRK